MSLTFSSPLAQGRGSKLKLGLDEGLEGGRPSRRGVDRNTDKPALATATSVVAPRAGAWIETRRTLRSAWCIGCRPSRRGVDRNIAGGGVGLFAEGRPSRRGVDRNPRRRRCSTPARRVAPRAGAWIETAIEKRPARAGPGRPSRRGVDRNLHISSDEIGSYGRPSRRGVDRNLAACDGHLAQRRPSRRGVDRNSNSAMGGSIKAVAPRAGAWIETALRSNRRRSITVAPRAGAWIETSPTTRSVSSSVVAPRAGAWIETSRSQWGRGRTRRRPSRRGVDRNCVKCGLTAVVGLSPLAQGRGSKHRWPPAPSIAIGRPSRRGVDRNAHCGSPQRWMPASPLAQGRGSKPTSGPHARRRQASPLAQGRGSKQLGKLVLTVQLQRRPSRRGVDRNLAELVEVVDGALVAPRAGAWIETPPATFPRRTGPVAPRAGAWIETASMGRPLTITSVAPRAGAWIETTAVTRRSGRRTSPLAQGRGSKLHFCPFFCVRHGVAPRAGAWIETDLSEMKLSISRVAPRAGAWIET